jgi:hypothetical protein
VLERGGGMKRIELYVLPSEYRPVKGFVVVGHQNVLFSLMNVWCPPLL